MSATLKQIAMEANVSLTTVSRVLNGTAGQIRICRETERQVLDIAKKLNYTPNILAKGLRSGKSSLIGVILGNVSKCSQARLLQGVENYLAEKKYGIIVRTTSYSGEVEKESIQFLLDKKVEGLIINSSLIICEGGKPFIKKLADDKTPTILLDQRIDKELKMPFHGHDDRRTGYLATRHLIDLGHTSILCVTCTHNNNIIGILRLQGYKDALAEAGIAVDPRLILDINPLCSTYEVTAYDAMREYLKAGKSFSAAFVHCADASLRVVKALRESGYDIPGDVSIVCEGNDDYLEFLRPPLTTIFLDNYKLGQTIAEDLLKLMNGESVHDVLLKPKLVERGSCRRAIP